MGITPKTPCLKKPLVYITPDIERALGREPGGGYFVVANRTPYAESIAEKYPGNVMLVDGGGGTTEMLGRDDVRQFIKDKNADVLTFLVKAKAQRVATEGGLHVINPQAAIADRVEGKISQIEWLGDLASLLPEHAVGPLKSLSYDGAKLILQFSNSHTGEGTYVVDSEKALSAFQAKFPERLARTLRYIEGETFTANAVVADDRTLVGAVNFQITGLSPFTELPFATVGNDWSLAKKLLNKSEMGEIRSLAEKIGAKLREAGWRGLFGIDVIRETKTGKIYLIEINARQPASTTLESQLQRHAGRGLSIFDAHIHALRGEAIVGDLQEIQDGAQIVQRVTTSRTKASIHIDTTKLEAGGFGVIRYENDEPNSDLVRITSSKGIMKSPSTFNRLGESISSSLS